jgi:aspartyl-tRNA(Asn)/glutamyl-tRNA(Gln) amidotransferase subunit C
MSLGRDEVLHVARLAELAVPEGEIDQLVAQFNRILDYVAQLNTVAVNGAAAHFLAGPEQVGWREDVARPVPLARRPAELAPEFRDGFFVVPRHSAMEDG